MDVLNDETTSEDTEPKINNSYALDHIFVDPNNITNFDIHIYTFNQSLLNSDDDIASSYPKLLDWDQHGPPIIDKFDNDDALINDLELYESITIDDHKEETSPKVSTLAYFGKSNPSSNYQIGNKGKNNKHRSLCKK